MPHKGKSEHIKKQAVVRRHNGESVAEIAKSLKVSNVAVYQWLEKSRKQALERSKRADMRPEDVIASDERDKDQLIRALKDENRRLRDKLGDLLINAELGD
jgi:transposase